MDKDLARFLSKVDQHELVDMCWIWQGATLAGGYGAFRYENETWYAHRWIYAYFFGAIPTKRVIHHECRNLLCVNPHHLKCISYSDHNSSEHPRPTTNSFNSLLTHCKHGHEFTESNTYKYTTPNGLSRRQCRECAKMRWRNRK